MSSESKTAEIDRPLDAFGFEYDTISATVVTGRLKVTPATSQPFGVLHGGLSALVAESLASVGAHVASGFDRVAGIHLSINHFKAAVIGDEILAEGRPISIGKTIQVWEVQLWKKDQASEKGVMVSSSRVTLVTNLPVPKDAQHAERSLRKYAKL